MVGPMVQRLVALVRNAPPQAWDGGSDWYGQAGRTCRALARTHNVTPAVACGVVAALSPRLQWGPNLRAAARVLAGGIPTGVFQASLRKALRIARGGERPLSVLSGPKVRAFYRALMGDTSAAVVDVWVLRAVGWTRTVKERTYAMIARALELAASHLGMTTSQLQAVAWVAVRGRAQ